MVFRIYRTLLPFEVYFYLMCIYLLDDDIIELNKNLEYNLGFKKILENKLSNEKFVNNAPEPSAELDIYWGLESETDHRITKGTGWLEILGCGMVDPNVLKNCGIDPEEYSGYAFGLGLERIAMLLYQIDDIRTLYENDVRFLNQFSKSI